MEILVTGGAGFIGANLCRALLAAGNFEITVLDNLSTGYHSNIEDLDVRFVEGDIRDPEALAAATPRGGRIVHLAALGSVPRSVENPLATHDVNATGTLMVLEAARSASVQQVILSSSSSVYGDNDAPAKHEELPTAPKSPYGATKLAAEGTALAFQRTYGLGVLAFRFFNVYGPLQSAGHVYAAAIPSFIDKAMKGESVTIHGDGNQSRDFTYVDTVCATILDGLNRSVAFDGAVNLAFGSRVSLLDIIDLIEVELGSDVSREHIESRVGDIKHSKADPARLRTVFPDIDPIGIEDGMKQTIEWFRTNPVQT